MLSMSVAVPPVTQVGPPITQQVSSVLSRAHLLVVMESWSHGVMRALVVMEVAHEHPAGHHILQALCKSTSSPPLLQEFLMLEFLSSCQRSSCND